MPQAQRSTSDSRPLLLILIACAAVALAPVIALLALGEWLLSATFVVLLTGMTWAYARRFQATLRDPGEDGPSRRS